MNRAWYIAAAVGVILSLSGGEGAAQPFDTGGMHAGFTVGAGLPKVPFSIYYPPVAVCGTVWGSAALTKKLSLRAAGLALHTFNIGTVTGEKRDLAFDLAGGSTELMYSLDRSLYGRQFVSAGIGRYALSQDIDERSYSGAVPGISIGLSSWMFGKKVSSSVDVAWIMLFEPSPRPQVLLVTLGLIL
ncbi:hypothetical protein JXO52_08505 [bacterium]|nr:hypothetical protein [bacterium]